MQPQTMKKFLEITLGLNAHGDPQLLRIVLVNLPISRWATAIQSCHLGASRGRISLFGQRALIRSSVRSEIFVDQPHPMEN